MTSRRDFLSGKSGFCGRGIVDPNDLRKVNLNVEGGFPKVHVDSHTGERFDLYNDRVKGRVFLITFMTLSDEDSQPVTANLREGLRRLGDHRVGREIVVNTITLDPENDTLEKLQQFAAKHDVPAGWCFLRGDPADAKAVQQRLYRFNKIGPNPKLVFYGNAMGNANAWGSFPGLIKPADIAERIGWVLPQPRPTKLRRAGPRRLWTHPEASHNREV